MAIPSDVAAGKGRFHSTECAHAFARENPANERQIEIAGVSFSLRELAQASGASKAAIADRIDSGGMSAVAAVLAGPRKARHGRRPAAL